MAKKLRTTSTAAQHRRSKLRVDDALDRMAQTNSEEDVDDTSQRSLKAAADTVKSTGNALSNEVSKRNQRKALRDAQIAAAQQEKMAKDGIENGPYTREQVQDERPALLSKQYEITYEETSETRYREDTRTRIVETIDPETGETVQLEEEYTVTVPYTWRTLTVKLENYSLPCRGCGSGSGG